MQHKHNHLLSIMWSLIEILMVLKIEKHSVPKRMDLFSFAKKKLPVCSTKSCIYIIVPYDLISKFQVGLKSLLRQGLSEPDFYGDLVYKLKKIVGSNNFSAQFIKIISHYKKIGYNINVLQQTACLVVNPITVGNFSFLFNCTPVGRTTDSMMVPT